MSERYVVLDEPALDDQSEQLQRAVQRAERAEAELAKVKHSGTPASTQASPQASSEAQNNTAAHAAGDPELTGVQALRQDSMMEHLLDSLAAGKDIGHYGRLVFAMVARHFLTDDEVIAQLTQDPDFCVDQAVAMLRQVEGHDYNPPRRERILEWQAEQEFPIIPDPADPDCGNVYRTLRFPAELYKHIEHYQEEKAAAA